MLYYEIGYGAFALYRNKPPPYLSGKIILFPLFVVAEKDN